MDLSHVFGLALKSSGLTVGGFIDRYLDEPVSERNVHAVLAGEKKSARVLAAVERLIADERPRVLRAFDAPRVAA